MSPVIEHFKRIYLTDKSILVQIERYLSEEKLVKKEYDYIVKSI